MRLALAFLLSSLPAIANAAANSCETLTAEVEKANLSEAKNEPLVARMVTACNADAKNTSARPFVAAGTFYFRQQKHDKAVPLFEKALTLEPGLPLAALDLCAAQMQLGHFDEAIAAGTRALEATDTRTRFMANYNVGLAHFKKMAATNALADTSSEVFFKKALELDPTHADSMFYLGMVAQFQKNDVPAGQEWFKKACAAGHRGACAQVKK